LPLYPRGPRSGLGCVVPVHPRLLGPIRPTRGHIAISPHRGLYAMSTLCHGLGDPRLVPCFHCSFCLAMPPSTTPGSSPAAYAQLLDRRRWPSHDPNCSALPTPPQIRFTWASNFGATSVRSCCGLSTCLPPLADPTGIRSQ